MDTPDTQNEATGKGNSGPQHFVVELHQSSGLINQNLEVEAGKPHICIIGAGFSGLCAAIKLKTQLQMATFILLEERTDVGGTWLANTYPSCACDVESFFYSFSFEPNPFWTQHYSSQPEILDYMKKCAKKYDLYPHIKFGTKVISMTWDDACKKWTVVTADVHGQANQAEFDIVINGTGSLRIPNYPEEFRAFKGTVMHSAEWNSEVDLNGKIVGVIGSGASAIQIIPRIAAKVKQLHIYQRNAPYVVPQLQFKYYDWVKCLFYYLPFILWFYRACIYLWRESLYPGFIHGSWQNFLGAKVARSHLKTQVKDLIMRAKLTPTYKFGCKRIMVASNYYPIFNMAHVTLNTSKIQSVKENSILTEDGYAQHLDVLILCTGFRAQEFFAPARIFGRHGYNFYDVWTKEGPSSYYGTLCRNAPNFFMLLGPNTLLGHGSLIFMIECQTNLIIRLIREMQNRDAHTVEVTLCAQEQYMKEMSEKMKSMVWTNGLCQSWYLNNNGDATTLYPGSCTHFWFKTKFARLSDFEFK